MKKYFVAKIMGNTLPLRGFGVQTETDLMKVTVICDKENRVVALDNFLYSSEGAPEEPLKGWLTDSIREKVMTYIAESLSPEIMSGIQSGDEVTFPLDYEFKKVVAAQEELTKAVEKLRGKTSDDILRDIDRDTALPGVLKYLFTNGKVDRISFDRVDLNSEYMPDRCLYIVLHIRGGKSISIRTDERTSGFDKSEYQRCDAEVFSGENFAEVLMNGGHLTNDTCSREDGIAAYDYLIAMKNKLDSKNRAAFRGYIVEVK